MTAPALSQHQQDALRALLQLLDMEPVAALRGPAGTGKTTVIPHIADAVPNPTITAMTHKAAAVLRAKGLDTATTFHAACMKPTFSLAYHELLTWLTAPDAPYPTLLRHLHRDRARTIVTECFSQVGPDGCARALGIDPAKQIIAWPSVQVYYEDVRALQRYKPDLLAKWLYTAVTRAKVSVRFFTAPIARTRTAA